MPRISSTRIEESGGKLKLAVLGLSIVKTNQYCQVKNAGVLVGMIYIDNEDHKIFLVRVDIKLLSQLRNCLFTFRQPRLFWI